MENSLYAEIGFRIRTKREELDLSREKLAECIDISPQFLAQIELGRRGMSMGTICKICSALSTSADYILLGREGRNEISEIQELISNLDPIYLPYAQDILKNFILAVNKHDKS